MKVRCPACKEKYEAKPYELRNDELCDKCASTLHDEEIKASNNLNQNEVGMTEQISPKVQKTKKYILLLIIGIITTIIAQCFKMNNPRGYTLSALLVGILSQPIAYFVILSIVALIIAASGSNIRKLWFPILAWLFLVSGLFDIVVIGFTEYVQQPRMMRDIEELVRSGKLELPAEFDPREQLLGHWSSEDDLTHMYFGPNEHLIIVNLGQQKDVKYSIEDFSMIERWVKFSVSGADYEPHTRIMYFLNDGTVWEVVELSLGKFKSKLKRVGMEQSP